MASSVAPDDDVLLVVSEQRREFMEAQAIESDMDLAFHIQLQEALAASLATQPSSSSFPQPTENDVVPNAPTLASLQNEELERLEQEIKDREQSTIEMRRVREDLNRRIHDDQVAREIMKIPEEEWEESGDIFAKPFGEGSSSSSSTNSVESQSVFRLYFKGLVSEEMIGNEKAVLAGMGVALCDPRDKVVFEVRKPLIGNGMNRSGAQLMALIEGLNAARELDIKRITFFCENLHIFQFVTGRWPVKQRKIATLVSKIKNLRGKFIVCNPRLVPRNDIKFAFKLARDAIVSQFQTKEPEQCTTCKNVNETCVICLEETDVSKIFSVDGCLHRYCFSCMKQHVEVKLLHGMIPRCPHDGCKSDLSVDSCEKFLTPKHVETLKQRIKEASIPATDKVYCPYPRCSALMSKCELLERAKETSVTVELSGVRRCMKCRCLFCINCKVPWHKNRTCSDYKKLNPHPPEEDTKLKFLASRNLWRQCVKCNHMIELAEGCYHMTCRCGYEFCYNCGGEWKDKKASCSCPLWDEGNILFDEDDEDFDEDDEVSDSDSESDYDDFDSDFNLPGGIDLWNELCYGCGQWKGGEMETCSCPYLDDFDEEYEVDVGEADIDEVVEDVRYLSGEDEVVVEDVQYSSGEDEVGEDVQYLSSEDDGDFDEEYEVDVGEADIDEVVEDVQYLSGEDDRDFDEEYEVVPENDVGEGDMDEVVGDEPNLSAGEDDVDFNEAFVEDDANGDFEYGEDGEAYCDWDGDCDSYGSYSDYDY